MTLDEASDVRMKLPALKFPSMRTELIMAVARLADLEFQQRVWAGPGPSDAAIAETLDEEIHTLYDDSSMAADPYGYIGVALYGELEARAIERLDAVLRPLIDSLPPGIEDSAVIALPAWQDVIAAAQAAHNVLTGEVEARPGSTDS